MVEKDEEVNSPNHHWISPEELSAERLAKSLEPWRYSVPEGPILELGAAEGHFTSYLNHLFPKRNLVVSDSSKKNIYIHKNRFSDNDNVTWKVQDLNYDRPDDQKFALICGNYAAHKFREPQTVLEFLCTTLEPGGLMLMAFPGDDSFKEWRSTCLDLGIPYTGQPLPSIEPLVIHLSMGPVQVDFYEDQSKIYFSSLQEFLDHSMTNDFSIQKNKRHLTSGEVELLTEHWEDRKDGRIGLTYHNVFLAVKHS